MHPQLTAALERLAEAKRDLHDVATALPMPLRARKPAPERWSVNEVLEHVSLVEQLFVGALVPKIQTAGVPQTAPATFEPAMLPQDIQAVVEDRSTPRMAPEHVQPKGQTDAAMSLQAIDAVHAKLRDALQSADSYALSNVTHDHRLFGSLNVYQWVDLMTGHERRHLQQLREIVAQVAAA